MSYIGHDYKVNAFIIAIDYEAESQNDNWYDSRIINWGQKELLVHEPDRYNTQDLQVYLRNLG